MAPRKMRAKFPGTCRSCGCRVDVGDMVFWAKGQGVRCADEATCDDYADAQAEQAAEMRMESWAEHRMAGTTSVFWENQDYDRDRRRMNDDYSRGYHETRQAQMAGPAGSAAREAAYMEMEQAAYNRGEDY